MIAAVLRELMAAGLTGEALIAAVERIEQSADLRGPKLDPTTERRRAYDRERMAKKRESQRISADNPPTPPTPETTLSSSFLLTESEDKKEESKKEKARSKICPPTFEPTEKHFAIGLERGLTPEQVRAAATEMIDWSHANSGRAVAKKSDWNLAFNSWLRRNQNGQGRSRQFQDDSKSVSRAAARLQEQGFTWGPRPRLLPDDGPPDLRLLPPRRGTGS